MALLDLPPSLTPVALGVVAAAALVAGLARGFSGFGAALIFVPVASAVVGPHLAVPLVLIVDALTTLGLLPDAWRRADRREVATMAVGALVGVPAGVWLLTRLDPLALRWTIVAVVAALFLLLASGWRYRGRPSAPRTVAVGLVAGFFSGSTQIGGPPVVAYWLGGVLPAATVRANLMLYFEVSTVISVVSFTVGGLMVPALVPLVLAAAPLYGLGIGLGARAFGLATDTTFRRLSLALIALAVILSLPPLDGVLH